MLLPVQTNPTPNAGRNPTLVPNFNRVQASGSGTVDQYSPGAWLATDPRADAQATAVIGGSVTTGDELTIELTNPVLPGGLASHTVTAAGGDTVGTLADAIARGFNGDANCQAVGIRCDVGGTSGAVITFHHNGPLGNFSVLSSPQEQPSTITVGGTALTGDGLYVWFQGAAFNTVAAASDVATLSGTPAAGDTMPLVITNSGVSGSPIDVTYTVAALDNLATIAQGMAALVNANTLAAAAEISATFGPAEVTVFHNGALGNNTVLTCTPTHGGGGSEAISFANSGSLAGGLGVPGQAGVVVEYSTITGNTTTQMATGFKNAINAQPALVALGVSATSSGAAVTLAVAGTLEPTNIVDWVNTVAPTVVIGGTVAAGNTVDVVVTSPSLPGGSSSLLVTAGSADTVSTLAAAIGQEINTNTGLGEAGFSATVNAGTITIAQPLTSQQARYTGTAGGSITVAVPTTPTETLTYARTATETITFGAGETLIGGTGPVYVTDNFTYAYPNGGTGAFFYGNPYDLGYDVLNAMLNQGMPIV